MTNGTITEIQRLDEVCERLFGLKPEWARRKAVLGTLPVPAFRLNESRKGPFFVRKADLDALVEKRAASAGKINRQMLSVTEV